MSIVRAINIGRLVVNGPIALIFLAGFFLPVLLNNKDLLLYTFLGSFVVAWLWWAVSIVKWRAWAYKNVKTEDIAELKRAAIAAMLTWPDSSIATKTEIKSTAEKIAKAQRESMAKAENITTKSPVQDWRYVLGIFVAIALMTFLSNFF